MIFIQTINPDTGRFDIQFVDTADLQAILAAGVAAGTITEAQARAACLLALGDYDGPTHAEMTGEHNLLTHIAGAKGSDAIYDLAHIIEEHLHNKEYSLPNNLTTVNVMSGGPPDTYGNWALVATAVDIQAAIGAGEQFDPGKLLYVNATNLRIFEFEIGYGDGTGPGTTIEGGDIFSTNGGVVNGNNATPFKCPLITEDGSNLYIRCKDDGGAGTFDAIIRIHGY